MIGRYVLPAAAFDRLGDTVPGSGGEIQLMDALKAMAIEEPIIGLRLDAPRYDIGDNLSFVTATVALAAERSDLGPQSLTWLREFLVQQGQKE